MAATDIEGMEPASTKTESPSPRRPRRLRRWFQFSLRSLLAAITLIAIVLGAVVVPGERQRRAVKAIQEAGGTVFYESSDQVGKSRYRNPDGTGRFYKGEPEQPSLWSPQRWLPRDYCESVSGVMLARFIDSQGDIPVALLRQFHDLESLDIRNPWTDTDDLRELRTFSQLRELRLKYTKGTDSILAEQVKFLPKLERLALDQSDVSDRGMLTLRAIPSLRDLDLSCTAITDAGLAVVATLENLVSLEVGDGELSNYDMQTYLRDESDFQLRRFSAKRSDPPVRKITDVGVMQLARLPHLQRLSLAGTHVTDNGLSAVVRMTQLRELSLSSTDITGEGIRQLPALSNLQTLILTVRGERTLNAESFDSLLAMRNLRHLEVPWLIYDVQKESLKRFKVARPDCQTFEHRGVESSRTSEQ